MRPIRGYLPEGLELLTTAIEAISAPAGHGFFCFPDQITLCDPNGGPYGQLVRESGTYRFYPDPSRSG